MKTEIPGLKASHQMITPTCRENRGSADAFDEAVDRIRQVYQSCEGSVDNETVTWHLVLVRDGDDQ